MFHNSNVFGSSIIHISYTECTKIKKKNFGAKRLTKTYRRKNIIRWWHKKIHGHDDDDDDHHHHNDNDNDDDDDDNHNKYIEKVGTFE